MKSTAEASGDVPKGTTRHFPRAKLAHRIKLRLQTFLVPTDFSRRSKQAIRWAKFIAQQSHGHIHLVHVHDYEYGVPGEIALAKWTWKGRCAAIFVELQ
jgi:nucleotide-binding universal stress UspA family protein